MFYSSRKEYYVSNAHGSCQTVVGFDLACDIAGEGGRIEHERTSQHSDVWVIVNGRPEKQS